MKLLNELLGFVVLTGPLFLIIAWLPVCIWIAVKMAKRFKRGSAKLASGLGVFVLIFLAPFADEITGHFYLSYLCTTEAGVKVYQTVELPAEYWDEQGRPKFYKANGDLDKTVLGERFMEPVLTKPYSSIFRIDERHQQLVDTSTHQTLGEVINFMHWGGWVSRNFSANKSAIDCKDFHGNKFWNDFYSRFFKSANSPK